MSCVMNLSAMTWYFIYTVVPFQTIIAVTGVTVFVSMVGIFIVVRPKWEQSDEVFTDIMNAILTGREYRRRDNRKQ